MSWDNYIDKYMISTKNITKGAIYGIEGGKWAGTNDLQITHQELLRLVKGFTDLDVIKSNGPVISGKKYYVIHADDRTIIGRNVICSY